jgi:hypothetical protein
MKNYVVSLAIAYALAIAFVTAWQKSEAQDASPQPATGAVVPVPAPAPDASGTKTTPQENAPPFVTEIPAGYRDWKLISVAREEGSIDDIRAVLGNDIAIKAYREGKLPFPEGAIIARLAWSLDSSEENNKVFGKSQSFVAGAPKNGVQFMVKDSTKYGATGGWGYGQFDNGKSANAAKLGTCFPCHQPVQSRDYIFTRYAP